MLWNWLASFSWNKIYFIGNWESENTPSGSQQIRYLSDYQGPAIVSVPEKTNTLRNLRVKIIEIWIKWDAWQWGKYKESQGTHGPRTRYWGWQKVRMSLNLNLLLGRPQLTSYRAWSKAMVTGKGQYYNTYRVMLLGWHIYCNMNMLLIVVLFQKPLCQHQNTFPLLVYSKKRHTKMIFWV